MFTIQRIKNFFKKVDKTDTCWNWTGYTNPFGYGKLCIKKEGQKQYFQAHRFGYMMVFGDIPQGMLVCHTCDNRGCVNPNHLFIGSQTDNMQDMIKKGRSNHTKKLSNQDKNDIIREYKNKTATVKELSNKFRVHRQTIYTIIRNI